MAIREFGKMLVIYGNRTFLIGALVVGLTSWAALAYGAAPDGAELRSGIEKLFTLGEKNTPPAVVAAKEQYEQLKRIRPKDKRIDYAYGLVLVNQHKYREAATLLSGYLDAGKADSSARCAEIWANVQDRQIATAIDDMAVLSRQFPRAAAAQVDPAYLDGASFLGAMFGYLDLVKPDALDSKLKSQKRNEILGNIGNKYLSAFDQGRDKVRDRLSEMQTERNAKQDQVAAAAGKKLEQDKTALEGARSTISAQQDTMKSSAETVQDAQRELNVIQQQLASLTQDRTRLGAQIITAQAQLAAIQSQPPNVLDFRRLGPQGGATIVENRINPGAAANAYALALTLTSLNKQAFNIDRQMLTLQGRATVLLDKGAKESETVAQSEEVVRKTSKQAKAIEKKLRRPETPTKSRAVMTPKMTSLATYIPFPYEDERERVLNWFAK